MAWIDADRGSEEATTLVKLHGAPNMIIHCKAHSSRHSFIHILLIYI